MQWEEENLVNYECVYYILRLTDNPVTIQIFIAIVYLIVQENVGPTKKRKSYMTCRKTSSVLIFST
jgi:hypothetical protein